MTSFFRRHRQGGFIALMVLAMTSWGGSWTSAKLIANAEPPEVLVFWRFLATVLSFVPVLLVTRASLRLDRRSLGGVVLGGALIVGYNMLFFRGLRAGLAGAGGVLVTTLNPLLTFAFAALLWRRRVTRRQALGLALGAGGGLILLRVWELSTEQMLHSGNALFLGAACTWAFLTLTSEKSKSYLPPLVFSFYVNVVAALLDFFPALPQDILHALQQGWLFWANVLYMAVFATTFATTVYFAASGRLGSQRASSFIFLVPFSAVLIAWLALGEKPAASTLLGGIIAMAAVYLINRPATTSPTAQAVATASSGETLRQ